MLKICLMKYLPFIVLLLLASCNPYNPGDRALGGAVVGAGAGALIGGPPGALIGGAAGAGLGLATTPPPPYNPYAGPYQGW